MLGGVEIAGGADVTPWVKGGGGAIGADLGGKLGGAGWGGVKAVGAVDRVGGAGGVRVAGPLR